MILKEFYTQKKAAIENELGTAPVINALVQLYSDTVFKNTVTNPLIMFKYDTVNWESSSEKTYKAEVSFSCYIVLPLNSNYNDAFSIASHIDKAILYKADIIDNTALIDTNSTFKVQEKQWTNEGDYWDKNDFFIWKISYKTTLVENSLKKKYKLIRNGATNDEILRLGYSLTDVAEGNVTGDLYLNTNPVHQTESSILTDSDLDNDGITDTDDTAINAANSLVQIPDENDQPKADPRTIKNIKIN
ncbi:hypothetical protein ABGT15_04810 [Flavobacterium enshiense]|uniref:hypothetical protein n=1 Tax=Flavobacterium enshiense TaxID=1341165 RepID=UPI00345DD017